MADALSARTSINKRLSGRFFIFYTILSTNSQADWSGRKWTAVDSLLCKLCQLDRSHDLRRTGATHMAKLKVLGAVIDRCLNHTDANKMGRIYIREEYTEAMRDAWRLLGERLELLQRQARGETENVVTLNRAA